MNVDLPDFLLLLREDTFSARYTLLDLDYSVTQVVKLANFVGAAIRRGITFATLWIAIVLLNSLA